MDFKKELDLCLSKLNGETNDSWQDIVDELGVEIHPDTLRRMAYGYRRYDDYLNSLELTSADEEKIKELKEKMLDIKKKRQQLSDERTYTNEKIRNLSRIEDFISCFKEELELLAFEKPFIVDKEFIQDEGISRNEGILLLSDIHFGLEINLPVNTYSPVIAKARMVKLKSNVLEYCKLHGIKSLHILELGDTISGHIHNTIRLKNRLSVSKQIIGVAEMISWLLFELSKEIECINFSMVEGNHDRIIPDKKDNLNEDSFCVLIHELIKQRCKGIKNLKINEYNNKTFADIEVCGHYCVGVHGDKDKASSLVDGIQSITQRQPDFLFMGHIHNANESTLNRTEVITNGSFCGTDEYAYNPRKNSKPIQKFMVMNREGRKCTYNIDVSKI